MGLGPPVCEHCQVLVVLTIENGWHCQYCGETTITLNSGFSEERWQELRNNEKFYKFAKGEDVT